MVLIYKTRGRP